MGSKVFSMVLFGVMFIMAIYLYLPMAGSYSIVNDAGFGFTSSAFEIFTLFTLIGAGILGLID